MSRPPFLALPPHAEAHRLPTPRGEFATHDATPTTATRRGTVLLVPGFTGSKEDFIALLEPIAAAGYRAVAVDGRGQHESAGPRDTAAYAQEELAKDVLAQAEALGGGVHLLGHSFGGLVSRAAVLLDASPFRSLTIMSCGPGAIAPEQRARTRLLIDALGQLDKEAVWQEMRKQDPQEPQETEPAEEPSDLDEFLHRRWTGTTKEQLLVAGRQLTVEPDRTAELAAVPLPKHVLSGRLDYAWPVPSIDAMAKELSAVRTVIEGAGHSPNAERPAETAEALVRFWDQAVPPAA
ncbi:alpha/beta fold hydrolase [Streptomyces sp. NPDC020379]|uniref:alpha/beta fold hydrolase n=1 Tax=Streptomyces sp. NPDC020379 TaxID=3365071 RepID=UPI0037BD2A43